MKVWKIASRWSVDGKTNSIIELFRKYKIAFVYKYDGIRAGEVEVGDLMAFSDSKMIVAVCKVLTKATPIDDFNIPEINIYNEDDCTVGFKVEVIDLNEKDRIYYDHRGRFHELHNEIRENVEKLWLSRNKKFEISAKTCTLQINNQLNGGTILNENIKYIIPIYQRPYSWTNEQISKFISDIFYSYWGSDNVVNKESMFIGTMQLSEKRSIDIDNNKYVQDVVDGQQRLTTFLILFKVLKNLFPNCPQLGNINLNWLETRVNNDEQQKYLNAFLNNENSLEFTDLNIYYNNSLFIKELLSSELKDEFGETIPFNISDFVEHLVSNIYFVVIETYAGLSKTLKIFNAINTTGLDLNAGDVFKIKMFEYLKDKKGFDDKVFNDVSNIYERIDILNRKHGDKVTDIKEVLSIYQFILISKYDLSNVLYSYGSDTFFERLFDTILIGNQWDNFKNLKGLELSLNEINTIIDTLSSWHELNYPTGEDACISNLLGWSRYSKYAILTYIFLFVHKNEMDIEKKLFQFIKQLTKLFIIYSIRYQKAVYEMHDFIYVLAKKLNKSSVDEVMAIINNKIGKLENHKGAYDFENILDGNLIFSHKVKNIVCRLSAMFDENYMTNNQDEIKKIIKKLYEDPIDIEHIQAYHDFKESERLKIWGFWGEEINSLGNLVVLDQETNRSIGNKPYAIKQNAYRESKYNSVKQIAVNYPSWDKTQALERKGILKKRILNYLFENS